MAYEGELLSLELEYNRLGFARLQLNLGEVAKAPCLRGDARGEVGAEQQHRLHAGTLSGVGYIDAYPEHISGLEILPVNLNIGVLEGGVAQTVSE